MTLTLLQTDIQWADIEANLQALEEMIPASERVDLYVLPEMFSTGFATKPEGIADTEGTTLRWMQRIAAKTDAAIAGTVAIQAEDGTYRNRFYFVKPEGGSPADRVVYYDKRHLFSYGGENRHYTPGRERVIVEWRGVRILLQVCYDLRFPVFSRNAPQPATICTGTYTTATEEPYDLALYAANWPDTRRQVWDILLRARALENQCYVAGINRVGDDHTCHYNGGTALIDAYGKPVCTVPDDTSGLATATLDIEKLKAFRMKFPVLHDADAI